MKRFFFRATIILVLLAAGLGIGAVLAVIEGIPDIEEIKGYTPAEGTKVYADDDTLIGELKIEKGIHASLKEIPEYLIRAVVSVEDSNFWAHKGIDYLAIMRALAKDVIAGRIKEGASTITQQLAKVIFLTPEKTVIRKIKEVALAFRLEKNLTKEEILELYLNKIYFGHGAYGVKMASRAYFGKSASDLTLAEAAMICGVIKAPGDYSPYNNIDRAKKRQYIVLKRMNEEGYITKEEMDEAFNQPLHLSSVRQDGYGPSYFLEFIRKYLEEKYGTDAVYKGGMKVYTTLNKDMQAAAEAALKKGLEELDKRQGFRGPIGHKDIIPEKASGEEKKFDSVVMEPGDVMSAMVIKVSESEAVVKAKGMAGRIMLDDAAWAAKLVTAEGKTIRNFNILKLNKILSPGDIITVRVKRVNEREVFFALDQEPRVQGALFAMEPSTGYVRALAGGYDFTKSEFNRAVFARRQAGSALKPFIYAAAMDSGFTPASVIIDEPIIYENKEFGDWTPMNYDKKYRGATRLREALTHSMNIVTIKLLQAIGVKKAVSFMQAMGLNGPFPHNLTLALGSISLSPLEITSAFATFANEGVRMEPITVKYITDNRGSTIENNRPRGERVISPQTAFLATSMLEDVVNQGTGRRAKALNRPVAGKTGTTNDYKDAWFVGYTTELAAGVWVGFDDQHTLGRDETGSKAASPVWVDFMKEALNIMYPSGDEGRPFPVPDGIVTAVIDPLTGLLATSESEKVVEFFKEGTVPKEYSTDYYRKKALSQKEGLKKITPEPVQEEPED
ncbi:MAG: PBP1A family penicillin-binding protein [Nitrospirae bacterium]|nr:PBP1A family penicillin-binding protein [Nitrospirota bacterium]